MYNETLDLILEKKLIVILRRMRCMPRASSASR